MGITALEFKITIILTPHFVPPALVFRTPKGYRYPRLRASALKDKINKFDQRGVVHKILCLDCRGVYIGETGRSFKTRRKEHQRDVKPDIIAQLTNEDIKKKCALMKHVCLNGH